MTKELFIPKAGKCDILKGILIGKQQTNKLNAKEQESRKKNKIISKLHSVIRNTSDGEVKENAELAISILENDPSDFFVTESHGRKIYDQISKSKK